MLDDSSNTARCADLSASCPAAMKPECAEIIPLSIWWKSLANVINHIITSGCVSPWTIQVNIASCPSPEYTIGFSTTISGGSAIEREPEKKPGSFYFYQSNTKRRFNGKAATLPTEHLINLKSLQAPLISRMLWKKHSLRGIEN